MSKKTNQEISEYAFSLEICNCIFISSQDTITRIRFTLQLKQKTGHTKKKYILKHWESEKDSDFREIGIKWDVFYDCTPLLPWESYEAMVQEWGTQVEPGRLPELKKCCWGGRARYLEFSGQSTWEKKAA